MDSRGGGRRGGGDRRNEPGEASSQQAAIQDHSLDELHPTFGRPPALPRRWPQGPYVYEARPYPAMSYAAPGPSAQMPTVRPQWRDALQARNLAVGPQQSRLFGLAGAAREDPDTTLRLGVGPPTTAPPSPKRRRRIETVAGGHTNRAPSASNALNIREPQPSSERRNPVISYAARGPSLSAPMSDPFLESFIARQVARQRQDALQRWGRNLALGSHHARLFGSAGAAREEPDTTLRLRPPSPDPLAMERIETVHGGHMDGSPSASNAINTRERQPRNKRPNPDKDTGLRFGGKRKRG